MGINFTVLEILWGIVAAVGFFACLRLYLRAKQNLQFIGETATNGARLLEAGSIKRRNFVRLIIQFLFLALAGFAGLFDRIPDDLRFISPLVLMIAAVLITLNTVLDARDDSRLVAYIRNLEEMALSEPEE